MELISNRPSPPSTIRTITIRDERRLFDKRVVVLRAIFLVKTKKEGVKIDDDECRTGERNREAEEGWDGVEAHRWIDFPSCRLVTESTVYSGKLQLFHYLPNDATVYERAI